ncbi:MAG: ATP-binding protein [Betaproteobacteria bacterium]|nr:ATP-binding protein [Betaproteobacteria bacterium]
MSEFERFILRLDGLMDRLEPLLPPLPSKLDFNTSIAFRWRKRGLRGGLEPVVAPHRITLADLKGVERQADLVARNSRQFVEGRPANNVLLTGARGTGKSSLVKAVLNEYAGRGLRLIEVEKTDLMDLPDIIEVLVQQPYRFILFSDDLSFEADEPSYKALKAVLDGSVAATPDNVLLYATSNRRHLMPEYMKENLETKYVDDEIHPSETVEEKVSLSERFGLWVSFYPFAQDEYLAIVRHWLSKLGVADLNDPDIRLEALQWALMRGSRSGRVAFHFARDWAGRHSLP